MRPELRARRPSPRARPRPRRGGFRWRTLGGVALGLLLLPLLLLLVLRWVPPPITAFMLGDRGPEPLQQHWVPLQRLPPHLPLAFIAAEDQRFPEHRGLDLAAIEKALEHNQRGGRMRGASTISQQVARNLFLWRGRSWLRKGLELPLTLGLELLWPKHRILEVYLNIAELGPGVYGVEAAARHHWGQSAATLSPRQAALLAAILPSPRRYSPQPAGDYVAQRAAWIQAQMDQLGTAWLPPGARP